MKARLVCWMLGTLSSDQKFIKEAATATGQVPMGHVPQNLDPRAERLALILYQFGESGFSKHRAPLVDSGEETFLQPDMGHLHLHSTRLPTSVRHVGSQAVLGLCPDTGHMPPQDSCLFSCYSPCCSVAKLCSPYLVKFSVKVQSVPVERDPLSPRVKAETAPPSVQSVG